MLLRVPDDVLRLIADLLEDPALAAGIREEGGRRRRTGDGVIPGLYLWWMLTGIQGPGGHSAC